MGELLRRYWMPIAAVAELDDKATKPVRLLGEDLVLYREQAGTYGLLDRHCAHRRADLMMRKRMLEQAELVARGGEPKAMIRDPAENACVQLPIIGREYFVDGYSRADSDKRRGRTPGLAPRKEFPFLTGQPEEIRQAFPARWASTPNQAEEAATVSRCATFARGNIIASHRGAGSSRAHVPENHGHA